MRKGVLPNGGAENSRSRAVWGLCTLAAFPLMASATISLGFLVGRSWLVAGWWLALAITTVSAVIVGGWRGGLAAALWAGITFFASDLLSFGQLGDYFHYHYPQALFLENGWNPIFQPTMEALKEAHGVALDTFRPVHTTCFPLLLAQWTAATDVVTGSLCGFVWSALLLAPAVCGLLWATLRRWCPRVSSPWNRALWVVMALAAGARVEVLWTPLDAVLFLAQLALLLLLIWMANAPGMWVRAGFCVAAVTLPGVKQSGVAFVAVAFMALLVHRLIQREWAALRADATTAMTVALGVGVLFFHPYATSWSAYGSPLFPAHSFLPAWQGWDITADLGATGAGVEPLRFLRQNALWAALFAGTVCVTWRNASARKWLLPMVTILLAAFLMPGKLYHYVRYTPFVPLMPLFALAALAEAKHLPRRVLRGTAMICVAGFTAFFVWQGKHLLSSVATALDLQTLLICAKERPEGLVLCSTRAIMEQKDSVYLRRTDIYPLRANTFFIREVFGQRAGLALEEQYAWDTAAVQTNAKGITDLLLFVRRDSPLCQTLTPRPLRLPGVLRFPERAWRIFRYRWL